MDTTFTLSLLNHQLKVYLDDPTHWAEGGMGRASLLDLTLRINRTIPHDLQCSTLIHEILHILSYFFELELEEVHINALTAGIFSFIRDNPSVIEDLLKKEVSE